MSEHRRAILRRIASLTQRYDLAAARGDSALCATLDLSIRDLYGALNETP